MREGGSRSSPGPGPGSSGDPHQPPELALHDTGSGPSLLLLHAFPLDASQWDHQVAALSAGFRCLRPDMWGCGESPELPEPLLATLDGYAAAQEWADHLSSIGAMQHDHSRRVGQNLFVSYGRQMPPAFVVGKWAEESKDYDERRFKCAHGEVCGHFTQIIWRGTKEVGCGVAGGDNGQFWVCFYSPPGNIIGYKPY